jgi:hypothetical protein
MRPPGPFLNCLEQLLHEDRQFDACCLFGVLIAGSVFFELLGTAQCSGVAWIIINIV